MFVDILSVDNYWIACKNLLKMQISSPMSSWEILKMTNGKTGHVYSPSSENW